MSGDVGAEVAAVIQARMDRGTSGRWIADYGETPQTLADALAPLIAVRVQAALAPIEAHRAWLESERDSIRAAYRAHNAGRAEGRPVKRPDLDTWANAYEVAERHLRAALDPKEG